MDVYVGLGLLAAGVVIVGFLMLDNWLKKRNVQINQLSGIQNSSRNEPEFNVCSTRHEFHDKFLENVSIPRDEYEKAFGTPTSELADLCDNPASSRTMTYDSPGDWTSEARVVASWDDPVYQERKAPMPTAERNPVAPANLLVLSVMAKPEARFESYDLLQAISAAGLQFGEMNIFHYYQASPVGRVALFSLASANKPGDFDLNHFAEFSCTGLMLFMDITQTLDPQSVFKLMLDTAERLAEDLDGVLCADPLTPWSEKLAWQYHQKIMQSKISSRHDIKTTV